MKNSKRPSCTACNMLVTHCLCDHVEAVKSNINLIVLQHSVEAKHHKNTVQLLKLCVPNCEVVIGEAEIFNKDVFAQLKNITAKNTLLLYPSETSKELTTLTITEDYEPFMQNSEKLNLIVVDANWKKSKKIFLSNDWLQELPSYHLVLDKTPSIYSIRKKRQDFFRSTLEATLIALNEIEQYDIEGGMKLLERFCELKRDDTKNFKKD